MFLGFVIHLFYHLWLNEWIGTADTQNTKFTNNVAEKLYELFANLMGEAYIFCAAICDLTGSSHGLLILISR